MSAGYIKTSIDFDKIQNTLDAAKALDKAGEVEKSKEVLGTLAGTIQKEINDGR